MKVTSAEISKILKKLVSEYDALVLTETNSSVFLASVGENPEDCRPEYDYDAVQKELESRENQIRHIKHAINVFNSTTIVPEYNITIDELLILIPQLSKRKEKLTAMANRMPKSRVENVYGRSNIIDYQYSNYDKARVAEDLSTVTDELSNAQLALDNVNHSVKIEIEL